MIMAITDRSGPDNTELILNLEKIEWARLPPMGYMVCAIGLNGWKYIGPVIAVDAEARTYTILPVATNPTADKIKAMGLV